MGELKQVDGDKRALELEITKSAFFVVDTIEKLENDENELHYNKPQAPTPPTEPKLEKATAATTAFKPLPYPPVNPIVSTPPFNWKKGAAAAGGGLLLSILGMIIGGSFAGIFIGLGWLIFWFVGGGLIVIEALKTFNEKKTLKAKKSEEIRNSDEYKQSCKEIDEKNKKQQAEIEEQNKQRQADLDKELHEKYVQKSKEYEQALAKYEEDLKYFNDVEIPDWKEELSLLQGALTEYKSSLKELYDKNIIPIKYRNRSSLLWLSLFLSTSQYDLLTAIERYDTDVMQMMQMRQIEIADAQLRVAQEQLQNLEYANMLNEQLVEIGEHGNDTLKSISNVQKGDIALREYRRHKAVKAAKKRNR